VDRVARLNFLVGRGEDRDLRHICPLKVNITKDGGGSLDFSVEGKKFEIREDNGTVHNTEQPHIVWKGKGTATVDSITQAQQACRAPERGVAAEWVIHQLQDGEWHPVTALRKAADAAGLSWSTIQRGAKTLPDLEAKKEGMPAKVYWRRPPVLNQSHAGSIPEKPRG
jgi:hypothetical protein